MTGVVYYIEGALSQTECHSYNALLQDFFVILVGPHSVQNSEQIVILVKILSSCVKNIFSGA